MDEKRNFRRFCHTGPVQFQFKDPNRFGGWLSCNLSEGGIRVYLNDFIPLNTELTLQVRLADETIMDCTGRVVWVEKNRFGDNYQAGLEFTDSKAVSGTQRKTYEFLSHHRHRPSSFFDGSGAGRDDAQAN